MAKKNQNSGKTTGKTGAKEAAADAIKNKPLPISQDREEKTANTSETSEPTKAEIEASRQGSGGHDTDKPGTISPGPEVNRKFTLSDVLLCLVELRANAKQAAIMSGCKQTAFSISVEELKSGFIDIPVKSKKDKA